jgi:deoxyribodipyrimidine photo-lyase
MSTIVYWFRNDLRLEDNPGFKEACASAKHLLPIYIHRGSNDDLTSWGFSRFAKHSREFLRQSLDELRHQLIARGSNLLELSGEPSKVFQLLGKQAPFDSIYCEQIEAPEERAEVNVINNLGFNVRQFWQSSMLDPKDLPFDLQEMPDVFTKFRQEVERRGLFYAEPISTPDHIPPLPLMSIATNPKEDLFPKQVESLFNGGGLSALAHLDQYFERRLPDTYKQTRNQLTGMDYSSKFSPWLAFGCCSARTIVQKLKNYESTYGANDGTYWLWFELLWRDYFRFLHFKYGDKLYRPHGLIDKEINSFDKKKFQQWISGCTGENFIDAGMRELQQTGFLSNRMRQVVASYWIYEMKGDWRAGAAWFESQLVDYDVYSNQGNWLYIAGRGTDPRGGRPFNVKKQAQDHDPDGTYRSKWLNAP